MVRADGFLRPCVPDQAKANETKYTGVSSDDVRSGGFGLKSSALSSSGTSFGSSMSGGRYRSGGGGLGSSGLGSSSGRAGASLYDDYDEPIAARGSDKVRALQGCMHAAVTLGMVPHHTTNYGPSQHCLGNCIPVNIGSLRCLQGEEGSCCTCLADGCALRTARICEEQHGAARYPCWDGNLLLECLFRTPRRPHGSALSACGGRALCPPMTRGMTRARCRRRSSPH